MMPTLPRHVVLLGVQRDNPTLGEAVSELGITGRIALVTAGWREREDEDGELSRHLGGRTVNLRLYARADALFAADPELALAYRERQQRLRERLDFYRVRVAHALAADHVIRQRRAPRAIVEDELRASTDAIRTLDAWHLARCRDHHRAFVDAIGPDEREEVVRHRRAIAELLDGCEAIAIAGGHVATLRNRLVLFDVARLAGARPLFAWAGGAMVVTERVVLFHDDPPRGPAESEILDDGLGLVPDVVVFPEPERRLDLANREGVGTKARRFAPSTCLALPARARVTFTAGRATFASGAIELLPTGEHSPYVPRREGAP
jgi:hypothetical protein